MKLAKHPLSNIKLLILFFAISPLLGIFFQNCARLEAASKTGTLAIGSLATPVVPPNTTAAALPFDISPRAISVTPGGSFQFTVTGPTDGLNFSVISGGGSVTALGLFTAPSVNSDVVIVATNSEGSSIYVYAHVGPNDGVLTLIPSGALIAPSSQFQFSAIGGTAPYTYSLTANSSSSIESTTGILHSGSASELVRIQVADSAGAVSAGIVQVMSSVTLPISVILTPSVLMTGQTGQLIITGGYGTPVPTILSGNATLSGNQITIGDTVSTVIVRITDDAGQIFDFPISVIQDPNKINVHISSSTSSLNLFTMAGSPNHVVDVTITIDSGVQIGAANTSTAALNTGVFVAGSTVKLINKGAIMGAGGVGASSTTGATTSAAGSAGGPAIALQYPLSILNQGQILGGGGGGGAGSVAYYTFYAGGGGGGGCGLVGGAGGVSNHTNGAEFAKNGSAGTTSYGVGGSGDNSVGGDIHAWPGGAGGFGGCWGQAGTYGGSAAYAGGAGGAAGAAVLKNGQDLIWISNSIMTAVKGAIQ